MQLQYRRSVTIDELEQILELQRANLAVNISEKEKAQEGFVTVSHDLNILRKMNDACPHTIARDGDKLVGYALSMHPKFGDEIEVLKPMFSEIRKSIPPGRKYIVMGQICIAKAYRGMGLFRNLYQSMWEAVKGDFDCIITEVDATNLRSLNAHYAVGFKVLKRYWAGNQEWYIIILE